MSDCATPWTASHQAPLSTGFSRQEYRSGLPFPPPHQIESGRYLTLGWSCGKLPASFGVPRGKALLGTTVHQGVSASTPSGSVPDIWEAKLRQPLPLLQEILAQGMWRPDTWPLPRQEPPGCAEEGGRKDSLSGEGLIPLSQAQLQRACLPGPRPCRGLSRDHGWQGPLLLPADAGARWRRRFPLCFTHNAPETTFC